MTTGRVLRVLSGTGLGLRTVARHPDSGVPLEGVVVPNWSDIMRLAHEGAKVMPRVGLIGWDIAPTPEGAVVSEMNVTPDFLIPQLADGRGMLDGELKDFLAERRRLFRIWQRQGAPLT